MICSVLGRKGFGHTIELQRETSIDRWCYSIERCQKVLRTKCKNKCKIEASIAEAYILEEVSNFTSKYYTENLPSVHNPPSRYNAGEADSNLSLFKGQLRSASVASIKTLNFEEWRSKFSAFI